MTRPDHETVRAALEGVYDPCSIAIGAPLSVVDMGLVTAIDVDAAGGASIRLKTTSPMCMLVGRIVEAAEARVRAVPGITDVTIRVDSGMGWSEGEISQRGRRRLEARRSRVRAARGRSDTRSARPQT